MKDIFIKKTTLGDAKDLVDDHISSLAFPLDSYLEDILLDAQIYCFVRDDNLIGYFAVSERTMQFFHVIKSHYRYAASLFLRAITEHALKTVRVMSQDSQLCALMVEWDYTPERGACWFTDSGAEVNSASKVPHAVLRKAKMQDLDAVEQATGDFFSEESGGFSGLAQRIEAETIFILENDNELLGCGIVEYGRICKDYMSIGMFVCPHHRQKGVAKTILLGLKDYAYSKNKKPLAGCWYYNTLSRKSLESAGMIATSMGYNAHLKKKDNPPKRTGNPPGESVE
ncbi:MAG: hypothetical protein HN948_10075 [Clostridia bacterium]|jgi:predicted acetyltransferase|nr:hypothetical protein [Clostridia bacterium]MBT7123341.1 hypothetical protein [Clostridia bacterium]